MLIVIILLSNGRSDVPNKISCILYREWKKIIWLSSCPKTDGFNKIF